MAFTPVAGWLGPSNFGSAEGWSRSGPLSGLASGLGSEAAWYLGPNATTAVGKKAKKARKKAARALAARAAQIPPPISPQTYNQFYGGNPMAFGFNTSGGGLSIFPGSNGGGGGGGGFSGTAPWLNVLGDVAQAGLGYLSAKEQAKAARALAKAGGGGGGGGGSFQPFVQPQFLPGGATPFVGPIVGAAARALPSILGGAAGSAIFDAASSPAAPPARRSSGSRMPRVITEPRQLASGRWTVDEWVRAPKNTGSLHVVRRRKRCSKR